MLLEYFLYPLGVMAVVGVVTLFFKDRGKMKDQIASLMSRMNWLTGDPNIKNDDGKVGEIIDKLDTVVKQTK